MSNVFSIANFLGRTNVLKNGYKLKRMEKLKTSVLKMEGVWKCGCGEIYLTTSFVCLWDQEPSQIGRRPAGLRVAVPLCVC